MAANIMTTNTHWSPVPFSVDVESRPDQQVGTPDGTHALRILTAAVDLLEQGSSLVSSVGSEAYSRRVLIVFNASIGGHYRHCLDHFQCLLSGSQSGRVDYDHRNRDRRLEVDPGYAESYTKEVLAELALLNPQDLDRPVRALCEVSYEPGDSPETVSTFGRELVYAIAHGIHHFAMISVIARLQNIPLPEDFGVAPSTVVHHKSLSFR